MAHENGDLRYLELDAIIEPKVALRPAKLETEQFVGLMESIRQVGVLESVLVRPTQDPNKFELVNGLQRYTAAKMLGLKEIPVKIKSDLEDDSKMLCAQIMANIHRIETKPMEYTNQLKKILELNPLMTRTELATDLGKSPTWLDGRLSLNDLIPQIQELVAEGKVVLSNAYILAKLEADDQVHFIDKAMTLSTAELRTIADNYKKQIVAARRKGEDGTRTGFQPQATLRKLSDLKEELQNHKAAASLTKSNEAFNGFNQGIQWVLQLDPDSVELQKSEHEKRQAEIIQKREEAKKQRLEERQKQALEEAAKIKAQLGLQPA